jgi:hypothetical protein
MEDVFRLDDKTLKQLDFFLRHTRSNPRTILIRARRPLHQHLSRPAISPFVSGTDALLRSFICKVMSRQSTFVNMNGRCVLKRGSTAVRDRVRGGGNVA